MLTSQIKQVMALIPGVMHIRAVWRARQNGAEHYTSHAPAGHFYSPIPSRADVEFAQTQISAGAAEIALRPDDQCAFWRRMESHFPLIGFPEAKSPSYRFYFENLYFGHGDAEVLFAFLCEYKPKQVIEVGSGFSSALMLDTNERVLGAKTKLTFIEPYPDRLATLLTKNDSQNVRIITQSVQGVPIAEFAALEAGDFLFVDSSHVAKAGSDVLHILFRVWPSLAPGVLVHFHDIFWPFEYPSEWFAEGRAWNEAYFLRAFLSGNCRAEILFMNSWFAEHHRADFVKAIPRANGGSSLWLRKV